MSIVPIVNLIIFNINWFGLVYFRNDFVVIALLLFATHIYYVWWSKSSELVLIAFVAALGISTDSILLYLGVFIFEGEAHLPLWLMTLWLCFATTLSHSLSFIEKSKLRQILLGFFFAPLSYIAGFKLGAVSFSSTPVMTYLLLGFIWAGLMLSFFSIKAKIGELGVNDV